MINLDNIVLDHRKTLKVGKEEYVLEVGDVYGYRTMEHCHYKTMQITDISNGYYGFDNGARIKRHVINRATGVAFDLDNCITVIQYSIDRGVIYDFEKIENG